MTEARPPLWQWVCSFLVHVDTGIGEVFADLARCLETLRSLVQQVDPFQVFRTGNRTGSLVVHFFRAAELAFGAGINDLQVLVLERIEQLLFRGQAVGLGDRVVSLVASSP